MRYFSFVLVVGILIGAGVGPAKGQEAGTSAPDTSRAWHEAAWTDIITRNGLTVSYIFYAEADNKNNGVVLRLENQNDHPVRYDMTVLFRGPEGRAEAPARGRVPARSMKTGERAGLFWVPFKDGRSIGQVGLRGLAVWRAAPTDDRESGR